MRGLRYCSSTLFDAIPTSFSSGKKFNRFQVHRFLVMQVDHVTKVDIRFRIRSLLERKSHGFFASLEAKAKKSDATVHFMNVMHSLGASTTASRTVLDKLESKIYGAWTSQLYTMLEYDRRIGLVPEYEPLFLISHYLSLETKASSHYASLETKASVYSCLLTCLLPVLPHRSAFQCVVSHTRSSMHSIILVLRQRRMVCLLSCHTRTHARCACNSARISCI